MAFVTLSCSVGTLSSSEPLFAPPSGNLQSTKTPVLVFPPYGPSPTPIQAVEIVPEATETPAYFAPVPTTVGNELNTAPVLYYVQAGDTLPVVAVRFGVDPSEITSPEYISPNNLLHPNQLLVIPRRLANTTSAEKHFPDSEVVFSPSAIDFDVVAFVSNANGYLNTYREWLGSTSWTSGAEVVQRVALENSINPRMLLALLEYQTGLVYSSTPTNSALEDYPMGKIDVRYKGLYKQLAWAVNNLSTGYYGWREGQLYEIRFSDGVTARLAPELNAGTVALQYYFAQVYGTQDWLQAMDPNTGFPALYERMFDSAWLRAMQVEPLYPPDLVQPDLILPFMIGQLWNYTGGPHGAWERDGARAALDFSPSRNVPGCVESFSWVLAAAPGKVVRSGRGVVVVDLDGDGYEQTGWALLYLHIATNGRIANGTWLETGDLIGYPSCEGGLSTGTHVHIARKYNGEWIPADGPLPFNMDGWIAHAGDRPYEGTLTRDGETVIANVYGSYETNILRVRREP